MQQNCQATREQVIPRICRTERRLARLYRKLNAELPALLSLPVQIGRFTVHSRPQPFTPIVSSGYVTYAIQDPTTQQFVYVGQTGDFTRRCRGHLRERKKRPNYRTKNIKTWMYDCLSAGLEPTFTVLEVVATEEESLASESAWVARLAAAGHPLLNRWKEHRALISSSATRQSGRGSCATPNPL